MVMDYMLWVIEVKDRLCVRSMVGLMLPLVLGLWKQKTSLQVSTEVFLVQIILGL